MASKSGDQREHRHAAGERPDRRGSDEATAFARLTRLHSDVARAEEPEDEEIDLVDDGDRSEERLQAAPDEAAPPPG